jgi:type I restriction enzyme M protein
MTVSSIVKTIQNIMRKDAGLDGDAQRLSQLVWLFFLKIIDDQDQQLELVQTNYISPIPSKYQWRKWATNPEGLTGDELLQFINSDLFTALKELNTSGEDASRRVIVRDVFQDAYNYMKSGHLLRQVVNEINLIDFNNLADRQHFGDIYEQLLNDLQSAGNSGEFYTPRAITSFMVQQIDPILGEVVFDPACGTGGFLTCTIRHQRENYVKTVQDEELLQKSLRAVEKKQLPHMLATTNMLLHGIENPKFVRHDNTLARPYVSYGESDRVDIILTNPPFGGKEEDGIESNFPTHLQTKETADLFLALIIRLLRNGGRAAVVLPDGFMFGEGVKTRIKEQLLSECNLHTVIRLPDSVFKPYAAVGTNLLFFEKGTPTTNVWFYEHKVPETQKAYSKTRPILLEHLDPITKWWGGKDRTTRVENTNAWLVDIATIKERAYNLDIKNPHDDNEIFEDPQLILAQMKSSIEDRNKAIEKLRSTLSGVFESETK